MCYLLHPSFSRIMGLSPLSIWASDREKCIDNHRFGHIIITGIIVVHLLINLALFLGSDKCQALINTEDHILTMTSIQFMLFPSPSPRLDHQVSHHLANCAEKP